MLDADSQILAGLPVDLITLSVIVDEVATISTLVLVEVCLGDDLVGEVGVLSELEDQAKTGLVEVLHADVSQRLESLLITVGDHLSQRNLVLHGRQPELGDTGDLGGRLGTLLLFRSGVLVLIVCLGLVILLTSGNLLLSRLGGSIDNLRTLLVQRSELGEVLLLELEDLLLELGFQLGVIFLDALQASHTSLNLGRERLDIARGSSDEPTKTALDEGHQVGVLGKDRGGSSTIQLLCVARIVSL